MYRVFPFEKLWVGALLSTPKSQQGEGSKIKTSVGGVIFGGLSVQFNINSAGGGDQK